MKSVRYILTLILVCLVAGCIRHEVEDCPPLRIRLEVKDKNYFNIDQVETITGLDHRLDENKPFRHYVGSLFYALYRQGEQDPCFVQRLYQLTDDELTHSLQFPQELPFGDYRLVVWGNIDTEQGIEFDKRAHTYRLHGYHQEGYDVYMGSLSLTYSLAQPEHVIELERVKGKLLIEVVGMPREIQMSYKEVDHLYEQVNAHWEYSGNELVQTIHQWNQSSGRNIMTDTYLAPTDQHGNSEVRVAFSHDENTGKPNLEAATTLIQMKRNEITVLRYVYDIVTGGFDIYLLIDDGWLLIHDMDVEEQ